MTSKFVLAYFCILLPFAEAQGSTGCLAFTDCLTNVIEHQKLCQQKEREKSQNRTELKRIARCGDVDLESKIRSKMNEELQQFVDCLKSRQAESQDVKYASFRLKFRCNFETKFNNRSTSERQKRELNSSESDLQNFDKLQSKTSNSTTANGREEKKNQETHGGDFRGRKIFSVESSEEHERRQGHHHRGHGRDGARGQAKGGSKWPRKLGHGRNRGHRRGHRNGADNCTWGLMTQHKRCKMVAKCCSQSHICQLQFEISPLHTEIRKLQLELALKKDECEKRSSQNDTTDKYPAEFDDPISSDEKLEETKTGRFHEHHNAEHEINIGENGRKIKGNANSEEKNNVGNNNDNEDYDDDI